MHSFYHPFSLSVFLVIKLFSSIPLTCCCKSVCFLFCFSWCVFQPANGCFACHLLVEIILFWCFNILNVLSLLFFYLRQKKMLKHQKRFFQPANCEWNTSWLVKIHNKLPLIEICCMFGMMFVHFLGEIALQLSDQAISLPSIPFRELFPTL